MARYERLSGVLRSCSIVETGECLTYVDETNRRNLHNPRAAENPSADWAEDVK